MPLPVCVKCRIECRVKRNAIAAEVMTAGEPYQVYSADLWHCPECGAEFVFGFGRTPVAEHYQPEYAGWVEQLSRPTDRELNLIFTEDDKITRHVRFWNNAKDRNNGLRILGEKEGGEK